MPVPFIDFNVTPTESPLSAMLKGFTQGYDVQKQQKRQEQQDALQKSISESEMASRKQQMEQSGQLFPVQLATAQGELKYQPTKFGLETQKAQADIEAQKALAEQRKNTGQFGAPSKYDTAFQKDLYSFQNQLKMDNPNWSDEELRAASSAYLSGKSEINGTPLPELSGLARSTLNQVQKRSSNAAIQNQAALMDELSTQLDKVDIDAAKKFTGVSGKIKEGFQGLKAGFGMSTSEDYENYQVFKDQTIETMDSLRSALKTSVVPKYVYATLGRLSNPNSTVWKNPSIVQKEFDQVKGWVNSNAKNLKTKATQGATASLGNNEREESNSNNDPLGIR